MTILPSFEWRPGATGIFADVSNEDYQRPESGLSRSIGELAAFRSPAHAKEASLKKKKATPAMRMGTLVHCGTLEPEKLAASYVVKPESNPEDPADTWDGRKGWCRKWIAANPHPNPISAEDERNLLGCVAALKANPTLADMLRVGHVETSVFVDYEGLLLKCRPDLIATDANGEIWVLDIKKTQDASFFAFQSESRRMHRDFQEAWYLFVLDLAGIRANHFIFAGVEEEAPHGVGMYRIDKENIMAAMSAVHRAIDLWRQGVETGNWPAYSQEIIGIGWKA